MRVVVDVIDDLAAGSPRPIAASAIRRSGTTADAASNCRAAKRIAGEAERVRAQLSSAVPLRSTGTEQTRLVARRAQCAGRPGGWIACRADVPFRWGSVLPDCLRYPRRERRSRQPDSPCSRRSTRHNRKAINKHEMARPNKPMTTTQAKPCSALIIQFDQGNTR